MAIIWAAYLETGVDWMDCHHKELFNRINRLLEAMGRSKGKEEVINLVRFLDNYVAFHFEAEEKAMAGQGFPGMDLHRLEHEKFKKELEDIKDEVKGGADLTLVLKVQEKVVDWLINHIGRVDKELGGFLSKKD